MSAPKRARRTITQYSRRGKLAANRDLSGDALCIHPILAERIALERGSRPTIRRRSIGPELTAGTPGLDRYMPAAGGGMKEG